MDKNMVIRKFCLPLIKEPPANILFEKEINSLEFTEIIGGMDTNVNISRNKRDIYLMKHGKKLFKTHPLRKKKKIIISIKREPDLFFFEIDSLLPKKIKLVFRNLCEWKIIIEIKNTEYKIGLNEIRKIDHNMDYANIDRILNELNKEVYVPSQEEIDAMLTPIKEVKVISQEEADSILSSIRNTLTEKENEK